MLLLPLLPRARQGGCAPRAFRARGIDQAANCLELVVAREDHLLGLHFAALVIALFVDLQMEEACEQVEQAVSGEHLFPEVGGAVAPTLWIRRVARAAAVALLNGKKWWRCPRGASS